MNIGRVRVLRQQIKDVVWNWAVSEDPFGKLTVITG